MTAPSHAPPIARGRFAPSPTGPLHFGSLVAAVGSFLHARSHGAQWIVRIEDLDPPREVPGAADAILHALEIHGLGWDGEVVRQSARHERYEAVLQGLIARGLAYPCGCTRREIADSAIHGIDGPVYPGTCRAGLPAGRGARAWRLRTGDETIAFVDEHLGHVVQNVASAVGDFVLRRADGLYAYQLAVVVDDADQGITEVVRGADLLDSTARQILLQRLLGLPTPAYLHLPVAVDAAGEKLSKQTRAMAVDCSRPAVNLCDALRFLGQRPPLGLADAPPAAVLAWARTHWSAAAIPAGRTAPAPASTTEPAGATTGNCPR
jgi:glutamyl-Q tRNA(Asp) synthetase